MERTPMPSDEEKVRRAEYSPFHPKHRATIIWGLVCAAAGVVFALSAQAFMPPAKVELIDTRHAIQGDTLPTAARQNRRHLIKAEGGIDVIVVPEGQPYSYAIQMAGATSCQMVSPSNSGVSTTATMRISPDDKGDWYPKIGQPVVLRFMCDSAGVQVGDSAVVVLQQRR